jgi:hypothetical protein
MTRREERAHALEAQGRLIEAAKMHEELGNPDRAHALRQAAETIRVMESEETRGRAERIRRLIHESDSPWQAQHAADPDGMTRGQRLTEPVAPVVRPAVARGGWVTAVFIVLA